MGNKTLEKVAYHPSASASPHFWMDIVYAYSWDSNYNLTLSLYPDVAKSVGGNSYTTYGTYFWFAKFCNNNNYRMPPPKVGDGNNYWYIPNGLTANVPFSILARAEGVSGDSNLADNVDTPAWRTVTIPKSAISFASDGTATIPAYVTVAFPVDTTDWQGQNITWDGNLSIPSSNTSTTITFYSGIHLATTKTVIRHGTNNITSPTKANTTAITGWATKLGYVPSSSSDNPSQSGIIGFNTSFSPGSNTIYNALYSRTLTVTYNGNGSTGGSTSSSTATDGYNSKYSNTTQTYNPSITLRSNGFTRTGYTFNGWNTKANGSGTSFSAGSSYSAKNLGFSTTVSGTTTSITLYALWTPIEYNIEYDFNGGDINLDYGYNYTENHNVDGSLQTWLYNPDPNIPIKYDNSQYTPSSGYVRNDYFRVSPPIRKGYNFVGWQISGMDSTTHNFWYGSNPPLSTTATSITITLEQSTYVPARHLKASSGTVIYKALWEPISYNISYNWNGGSHSHTIGQIVEGANSSLYSRHYNPTTVNYDNSQYTPLVGKRHYVFTVDTPTKTGYSFSGWTLSNMDNLSPDTSPHLSESYEGGYAYLFDTSGRGINTDPYTTQNNAPAALEFCKLRKTSDTVTFTANWTANTLTVQFNANGGTGSMSNETFTYGTAKTLTANSFTAPPGNYKFGGWAASSAEAIAGTIKYNNKESVTNPNGITSGSTTLYAIWYKSIKFYSGNNKGTKTTVKLYYNGNNNSGGNITTPTKATCTDISGWTELGWRDDQIAGGSLYNFNTSISPSVTSYYAVYSRPVTFYHGYNKASSTSVTLYYNSYNVYSCTTPAKTVCANIGNNWNPVGWRSDPEVDTLSFGFNQTITRSNNIFYAIYSRTINFYYFTSAASATSTNDDRTLYLNSGNTTVSSVASYPLYANATYGWSPLGWRTDTTASTASTSLTGTTTVNFSPAYNISPPVYCAVYNRSIAFAYNAHGGGTAPSNTTGTLYYNANNSDASTVSLKTAGPITRVGYTLTQWALDSANGDTKYDVSTNVTFPSTGWLTAATRTLYAVWDRAGSVYINTSDGWQLAIPYIWDGSQWKETLAYVYNGSAWKTLS